MVCCIHHLLETGTARYIAPSYKVFQFGDMPLRKLKMLTMPANAVMQSLKNYGVVQDNPSYKGKGGLTQKNV